ncbi:MAG: ATP-binding protein, partial [Treponemataceae bacterium]
GWNLPFSEMDTLVGALVRPCRSYGRTFSYELELLATELASNIFVHAYGIDSDVPPDKAADARFDIRTELRLERDGIVLDLWDQGTEFTVPEGFSGRSPSPENLAEGGYGLSLLSRLSEEAVYERTADGSNHWHIVKKYKEKET